MKHIIKRMLASIFYILCSVWILLSILLYIFQPKFVFFPISSLDATPADIGLEFENIFIKTEDGVVIHGWYIPHENPRATLLFLHGNGGNISHRLESLAIFNTLRLSTLIIDYHGYGQSEGRPSEQGTYQDARSAWNYLLNHKDVSENNIIIFGRSLGGAVATWLASQHQPKALILESVFTSVYDMGKHYYPYLPVKFLTRIKYSSIDKIKNVSCPVLFVHSPTDEIVPYKFGKELYMAANEPKSFLDIQGGHNDGFFISGAFYINGLDQFISTYVK